MPFWIIIELNFKSIKFKFKRNLKQFKLTLVEDCKKVRKNKENVNKTTKINQTYTKYW